MSDKKKFLDKDYTRRQFLKLSGKTLAGVTLSSTMLSTLGFAESENPEEEAANSTVWALPQMYILTMAFFRRRSTHFL